MKPRNAWCDEPDPFTPQLTVYETGPESIDTGLLDASGNKIFRRQLAAKIGFDLTPTPPRKRRIRS